MTQFYDHTQKALVRYSTYALILLALMVSACQKQEDSIEPNFTSIWEKKLSTSCANCHQPGGNAYLANVLVDFRDKNATYNWLLSAQVQGMTGSSDCWSVRIITPGSPEQSYLIGILSSSYNKNNFAGKNGCQPITDHIESQYASSKEQEAILNWIQNGSQFN